MISARAGPTTASPLEEMQLTARSDGGLLVMDVDGTWRYFGRAWTAGRPDQPAVVVLDDDDRVADRLKPLERADEVEHVLDELKTQKTVRGRTKR